ncbi:MAG: HNH endonuclease [Dehalococcoidia bacterium]|nr:HNH endonuclease [Dehalococcoidia bacterium]
MYSDEVEGLNGSIFETASGFCKWCGQPVKRKGQRFCSPIQIDDGRWHSEFETHHCYAMYSSLWLTIPRWKRVVIIRDKLICQICGEKLTRLNEHGIEFPDPARMAVDHIHPYSKGGETKLDNLQLLCRPCNYKKRDKTELTERMKLG